MGSHLKPILVPVSTFVLAVLLSFIAGTPTHRLFARQSASTTCSDPLSLPICVRKILAEAGPGGSTSNFTPAALTNLQDGMNAIWAACCISFTLSKGDDVTLPADAFQNGKLPVANSDGQTVKLNKGAKQLFKQLNSKKCLNLYYVGDAIAGGLPAGSDLKGAAQIGDNGMIVDDGVSAALDAHEAGHNLGLSDSTTAGNLMKGVDSGGNIATGLTTGDCDTAKKQAKKYLKEFAKGK